MFLRVPISSVRSVKLRLGGDKNPFPAGKDLRVSSTNPGIVTNAPAEYVILEEPARQFTFNSERRQGEGERGVMTNEGSTRAVERLFPFASRARILIIGRDTLRRSKGKLHFVLITRDISENSRAEILRDFRHYPLVQHYTTEELEKFFGIKKAKVVGFRKSDLAQSIYAELKQHRINQL